MVKNLLAMQDTWVLFLGREDPLEKRMATNFSILAWRIPRTEEFRGITESDMTEPHTHVRVHTHTHTHTLSHP